MPPPPYRNLLGNWKFSSHSGSSSNNQSSSGDDSSSSERTGQGQNSHVQNALGDDISRQPDSTTAGLAGSPSAAAPSNVSVSSRPSTVSSYQANSIFSRNASTLGSVSTGVSSSRYMGGSIPENDQYDSSGKLMKILDADEISSMSPQQIQEQQQQQSSQSTQRSFPTMSIRIQHTMPEVPLPESSPSRDIHGAISPERSFATSPSSKLSRYLSRSYSSSSHIAPNQQSSQDTPSASASGSASLSSSYTIPQLAGGAPSSSSSSNTEPSQPPRTVVTIEPVAAALGALNDLYLDISAQIGLVLYKAQDLQRVCGNVTQALRSTANNSVFDGIRPGDFSIDKDLVISRIIKVVFHLTDSLLVQPQLQPTKMYLLRALYQLGLRLKLVSTTSGTVPRPENFAMGSNVGSAALEQIQSLLEEVTGQSDNTISEQEGAFIAPILRGFSAEFSVPTLLFGFPRLDASHLDMVVAMYSVSSDIHLCCQKNYIRTCGSSFKAPYRVPEDPLKPPISISLAADNASSISGTLGGYIYPKMDPNNPDASNFDDREVFAMTCAHVCLSETTTTGATYPNVSVPSPVLIKLYHKALQNEANKYPEASPEKREYMKALEQLDRTYPDGKPTQSFGQVVWGERTVVNSRVSDLAIIKCNNVKNDALDNFLGNDVAFSEYDPALMFGNLYVRRIVRKLTPGMKVFKYASTSKYTSGQINGPRMVYWADGRIQSSEFVVRSESPMFASGGDSGAWVLQKFEEPASRFDSGNDRDTITTSGSDTAPSLGVVGMLHSYDGDRKEFGLFTPMDSILERLREVTNIHWGIVGVPEDYNDIIPAGGSDSDTSEDGTNSDKSS